MPRLKVLVLAALFLAGLAEGWGFRPYDRAILADDQLYFYVAERAASGVPPHVSLVDHKHQLSGLISGAAIAVGRRVYADDVMAARVPSMVAAAAVVPLLCVLGATLTGSFAAGVMAALCALTFRMFFIEAVTGFRPQLFMTFFAVAALAAHARSRFASAGALAACAFLCWQPAIVIAVAVLAAAAFAPRAAGVLRIALGALAVVLVYEAYFIAHGALREQLYQSYLLGRTLKIPAPVDTLRFLWRGDPSERAFRPDAVFSLVLVAGLACLWVWALARPRDAWAAWRRDGTGRAVLLAAHGALAFTALDHQAYPDRFFLLPYVALAAAAVVALVPARARTVPVRGAVCGILGVWMLTHATYGFPAGRAAGALGEQRALARELVRIADARGGGLWVIGRPDLLAFERRQNWNAFGMLLDEHVYQYARRITGARRAYRPVRDGKMPDMVVASRVSVRRQLPWLVREYDKVDLAEFRNPALFVRKQQVTDGSLPIIPATCGDPIGDRFVVGGAEIGRPPMATDALYVMRAALQRGACRPCVCDIDGSGKIKVSDGLRLLKIASGERLALRCPPCDAPRVRRSQPPPRKLM